MKKKWGRQLRGNAFLWCDNEWIEIKHALQAGAEVYTEYHKNNSIDITETQDYSEGFGHLSQLQMETMECFHNNKAFKHGGVLSSKVDGSLIVVNVYRTSWQIKSNL
jgi:predicted outer membrane repeat protein